MTGGPACRAALVCVLVAPLTALGCGTPAAEAPGLTGPVGPVTMACSGTDVTVGDDIQQLIDSHGPGTTFCLSPGTYRLTTALVPRRADALVGAPGAVLSGARVLTGWQRVGDTWRTPGFLPRRPDAHGECAVSSPGCTQAEDVFLDKHRLRHVSTSAQVSEGTVYLDHIHNTITVGDDPAGHLLEQAVAPSLVRSTEDDVTVAGLVLEEAANEAQVGAVEARRVGSETAGSGWRILHNEVRLNHGTGIGIGSRTTVSGNLIHDQGQLGFGAWGSDSMISNNEISANNTAGYSADWEAGGGKSWMTTRLTLTHNYVHDNTGPGLWADGGNIDGRYSYNRIDDNWAAGIQYEISYDASIEHNEIVGNGERHKGWGWDSGIQIQSSGGNALIDVANNVVADNANGIMLIDSGGRAHESPAPHGPHVVRNVWVHDNTVMLRTGQKNGAVEDTGNDAIFTTNNNRFEANSYGLNPAGASFFVWRSVDLGWQGWRRAGNDLTGHSEVAAHR